jgi:hypothetical protein
MNGPAWGQGYGQAVDELGTTRGASVLQLLYRIGQKEIQALCTVYEIDRWLISLIFIFLSTAKRMR